MNDKKAETFSEAFARWSGFRDGEYHQEFDAIGLWQVHDRLPSSGDRTVRELEVIADAVASVDTKEMHIEDETTAEDSERMPIILRRGLRRKRWARRLMDLGNGKQFPELELTKALFEEATDPEHLTRKAQMAWGEVCLKAFLSGDFERLQEIANIAKRYGQRKEERTLASQVIEIAWNLRCQLSRDPTKEEVKQACERRGVRAVWRKMWGNARLGFLPD